MRVESRKSYRIGALLSAGLACVGAGTALGQTVPVILSPMNSLPKVDGSIADRCAAEGHASGHVGAHGHIEGCGKAQALRQMMAAGTLNTDDQGPGVLARGAAAEAYTDTDLLTSDLDLEIIPGGNPNIIGTNVMTVKSLRDGLTQFTIVLRVNYTVTTCTVNGVNAAITPGVSGNYQRTITLNRPYNNGEIFTVVIGYRGVAQNIFFGSIDFTTQNGQNLVTTLSQPYYAATWWPIKDGNVFQPGDNADKFISSVAITAPTAMRSVSNGLLQGIDTLSGSRRKFRWKSNYPIAPYLVSFGSTNYNTYTTPWNYTPPGGGTPISMPFEINVYSASDTEGNRNAWNLSVSMLTTFSNIFGTYPFAAEKYGMYQTNFSGGMEHQTNTAQGTFSESVTAHELAHQWWGDAVTCRYWNDIWLNEGAATYGEVLWQEFRSGASNATARISNINSRKPAAASASAYKYSVTDPNAIFDYDTTYEKGAWVYHMLRRLSGDPTFFAILAEWRSRYEGSAATTNDFAQVCSDVLGRPMQYFFDQWAFGTGEAAYSAGYQNAVINGKNYVRVSLNQTQSTAYGSGQKFIMPVDLRLNSTIVTVNNDQRNQWYLIPTTAAVTSLTIDPNSWILTSTKTAVAYANGPAKVVEMSPLPGSTTPESTGVGAVSVVFSENVNASAANFTVTGPGGPVPFTYSYSPTTFIATLTFASNLAGGAYTVGISDLITTAAAGIRLDGEVANPNAVSSLPSGNGVAQGSASLAFKVRCASDIDGDDAVDFGDFLGFFNCYDVEGSCADIDGNPGVDFGDFLAFFNSYDSGCGQ
jgi:aminopeptidase N